MQVFVCTVGPTRYLVFNMVPRNIMNNMDPVRETRQTMVECTLGFIFLSPLQDRLELDWVL